MKIKTCIYTKVVMLGSALVIFCSCRTETKMPPLPSVPGSFSAAGGKTVPQKWWTEFNDSRLNGYIESALKNNFSIKTAWERLNEAKAVYLGARSGLFPEMNLNADGSDRRGTDLLNKEASVYNAGLFASYEIDLWGRIRSETEAEFYRIKATEADLQAAALTLTGEIALTWFQIIEGRNQLIILKEQIATNSKALKLLQNRYQGGQIRKADVLRQESLIKSSQEQIIIVEARTKVLEHILAVYLGIAPQEAENYGKDQELPELPEVPDTGVPAELVTRRPDVIQAFNLITAANRDLAAAMADRYPRLTLSAAITTVSGDPAELFRDWIRTFAANLTAPLLDGGERRAEVRRSKAVQRRRVNEYGQIVLQAFREVEDALILEKRQKDRIANIKEQLKLAEQTHKLVSAEYFNGTGNFLDMLQARANAQDIKLDLISSELELIEYRIALYRALAGNIDLNEESDE